VRRFGVLALVVSIAAAIVVSSAQAALFFLFEPTVATANDMVTVRLGGTPVSFTHDQREPPFERAIRVYLVPREVADDVRARFCDGSRTACSSTSSAGCRRRAGAET
jgi:hypothetical protein